jgi:putative pyruvate formate lyase activating enzyme
MHRQVGDLVIEDGIAQRGLLIRHLVLPNNLAGTKEAMHFIAQELSKDSYVNVMVQYRPEYRAHEHPLLNRPPTTEEYREALEMAKKEGLHRFARDRIIFP